MKLSELIMALQKEFDLRGDCTLVRPHGDIWVGIAQIEIFKTPYDAPPNTGYLEITTEEP